MALPVLITVAALGGGYILLSRERSKMAGAANPDTQPKGADPAASVAEAAASPAEVILESAPASALVGADGNQQVIETEASPDANALRMGSNEQNNSTGGADPATQASTAAVVMHDAAQVTGVTQVYYGSGHGKLTRSQEATALAEIGALSGMVW